MTGRRYFYDPLGCYYDNDGLQINNNGNTGLCARWGDDICLCGEVTSAPHCANRDGTIANPECICDNTICGADQYCTEGFGCHAHAHCLNQDATVENPPCQCGTVESTDGTVMLT